MRRLLPALLLLIACGDTLPEYERVEMQGDTLRLPLDRVADGQVHFYSIISRGKRINFLVRSDASGALHAHLDACYACYHYRRGFIVENGAIVCRACRYAYDLRQPEWNYIGACAPITVPSSLRAGELRIRRRAFERAERYF